MQHADASWPRRLTAGPAGMQQARVKCEHSQACSACGCCAAACGRATEVLWGRGKPWQGKCASCTRPTPQVLLLLLRLAWTVMSLDSLISSSASKKLDYPSQGVTHAYQQQEAQQHPCCSYKGRWTRLASKCRFICC